MPTPTGHPVGDAIAYLLALFAAFGLIYRFVWPLIQTGYRVAKTAEQIATDYQKSGGFAGLYKELHPNGGGSLRDAVDEGRREAQDAARAARAAVEEAERIGHITEELKGHAEDLRKFATANRDGIARLDQKVDAQAGRITEHRRRQDETVRQLAEFIETEHHDTLEANAALRASVTELLNLEDRPHHD